MSDARAIAVSLEEWRELRLRFILPENAQRFVSIGFGTLEPTLDELREWYVWMTLAKTDGKVEETTKILGINQSTLYRWLRDWDKRDGLKAADPLRALFDATASNFGRGSRGALPRLVRKHPKEKIA